MLRRTRPTLSHVDDACDEFARRGFIEWNPEKDSGWASATHMPNPVLRRITSILNRGKKRLKVSEADSKENYRKLYDAAEGMRREDPRFRALTESVLANDLLCFDRRAELREEMSPSNLMALLEMTPGKKAALLAKYPSPEKRRPGRTDKS